MKEIGASTEQVEDFVARVRAGIPVEAALTAVGADPAIRRFVCQSAFKFDHPSASNFDQGKSIVLS